MLADCETAAAEAASFELRGFVCPAPMGHVFQNRRLAAKLLIGIALLLLLVQGAQRKQQPWTRTDLYFGSGRPGEAPVPQAEFFAFLDREVTPRFPEGLTVVPGYGQYRDGKGRIVRERCWVLTLLGPAGEIGAEPGIDAIRAAYRREFKQDVVLRIDTELRQPKP